MVAPPAIPNLKRPPFLGDEAKALRVNKADPSDAMDVLAKVGGFEIGGIAGLILGAASLHKPVVIDGFIWTAGALIAYAVDSVVKTRRDRGRERRFLRALRRHADQQND